MAHSHGCWQKESPLSIGLLECPHDIAVEFSHSKWSKRGQSGRCNVFYDPNSEVTHHHFWYSLLVTESDSIHRWGRLHKGMSTKRWGSLEPSLRLATIFCPLAPMIHVSLKCKIHSLPPKIPKVSTHYIISFKSRIFPKSGPGVDEAPRCNVLNAVHQI